MQEMGWGRDKTYRIVRRLSGLIRRTKANPIRSPRRRGPERFGALEIGQRLEFGRKLDRQVCRVCSLENAIDVGWHGRALPSMDVVANQP